ncbi:MAG: thiamine pyrophosphate-dependent dehydrogenase E1 component subunit alpha [Gemmatimonadaceae bacterium]|nr:thiamine pyrophosphate-dependent dehydrogenase E1 component subunit alpha [Gemmatimonadaceae bacterium]MBA3655769.1 thiamine pyrophosphate-dependent dehydrogenase E1 component subunit alpha [Gemmatimonadaceae bacterium]
MHTHQTPTHAGILKAGRYTDVRVRSEESKTGAALFAFMTRLRMCEEALIQEYHPADEMRCPVHFCVGQEAVPAALSLLLDDEDYLFSHHRSHGYYLAKGAPMDALFAELYGKATGANAGLAGSQDISYQARNFYSGAILAGAVGISVGAALGLQLQGKRHVAVCGFGESATDEGIFWEAVNYAAVAKLPVVFVCENNNYSVFSPQLKRQAHDNLSARVATFGVRSTAVFGNDVMEVHRVLEREIAAARAGEGPAFVEAFTYRWSGHCGPTSDDLVGYRDAADLDAWKQNCPIRLLEDSMSLSGFSNEKLKDEVVKEAAAEIAASFASAKSAPFPDPPDWSTLNMSSSSPLADELLAEFDTADFDAQQEFRQAVGY